MTEAGVLLTEEPAPQALPGTAPPMKVTLSAKSSSAGGLSAVGFCSAKYQPHEWHQNNSALYDRAVVGCEQAEYNRFEAKELAEHTTAAAQRAQQRATAALGERLQDIHIWKVKLQKETEELDAETSLLASQKQRLERAFNAIEFPYAIATDNLRCRERRQHPDLVSDEVERELLKRIVGPLFRSPSAVANSSPEIVAVLVTTECQQPSGMSSNRNDVSSEEACVPAADGLWRNEDFVAMPMTFAVQKEEKYIISEEILPILQWNGFYGRDVCKYYTCIMKIMNPQALDCLRHTARLPQYLLTPQKILSCNNRELELIGNIQELLKRTLVQAGNQMRINQDHKEICEMDWSDKVETYSIDDKCERYSNQSTNVQFHPGSVKFEESASTPETWVKFSHDNIHRAEQEKLASSNLRALIDNILHDTSEDLKRQCTVVNEAFAKRCEELDDAKHKLEHYLKNTLKEIGDQETTIAALKQAIKDKEAQMKVTQTRLYVRSFRPKVELCRDEAQFRLINEVEELTKSIESLKKKLLESEESLRNLEDTRMNLEREIAVKTNSIFIDKQKCMALRTRYPTVFKLAGYQ